MEFLLMEVHIKPERLSEFLELIRYDAERSEQDEPGCLRFDVLQDTEDELKFFYYEVYRDEAARLAHRETPHFKRYVEVATDMMSEPRIRHSVRNVVPEDSAWR